MRTLIAIAFAFMLAMPAMADDRCGFRPGTRVGCTDRVACVCDQDGACRWIYTDCRQ
jgi:hypothetical protein